LSQVAVVVEISHTVAVAVLVGIVNLLHNHLSRGLLTL
jgi:hypothetical protein